MAAFHASGGMFELSNVVQRNAPLPAASTADSDEPQQLSYTAATDQSIDANAPAAEQVR